MHVCACLHHVTLQAAVLVSFLITFLYVVFRCVYVRSCWFASLMLYQLCSSTLPAYTMDAALGSKPLLMYMLHSCRLGRKVLFAEGGLQMFICFVVVAAVMGSSFNKVTGYIPRKSATTILAFECLYTAGFAWSWGPLGWLVPSEFHNIETRGTGQAITVCVNFLFSFVIGQCYLTMLCQ